MAFWTLTDGSIPKGDEASSHVGSFVTIPDGTTAIGMIKEFVLDKDKNGTPLYKVTYKLMEGDFKGREVIQKVKCFDVKTTIVDRSINMMKRLYDLCKLSPTHNDAPQDKDLLAFKGKLLGIKIAEWNMVNNDGVMSEGNYISEVHDAKGFESTTGIKMETISTPTSSVESAFSRNPKVQNDSLTDDIPYQREI